MLRSLVALASVLLAPLAHAQCGLVEIFPQPGYADSAAWAVSADGQTVAGASLFGSPGFASAFRWTAASGLQPLGTLGGDSSEAFGISADGTVIVGTADSTTRPMQPVRWTAPGAAQDLLGPSGLVGIGEARDASADGSVVVGWWTDNFRRRAFRWTAQTGLVDIGPASAADSEAFAVSDVGQVIVGRMRTNCGQNLAFRWTAATGAVALPNPTGGYAVAQGISADGQVAVGRSSGVAIRWSGPQGTATPLTGFGQARACNADGSWSVGSIQPAGPGTWSSETGAVRGLPWIPMGGALFGASENGVAVGYTIYDPMFSGTRAVLWQSSALGTTYCADAVPNSTGCIGRLSASGSPVLADDDLRLDASSLPQNEFGFFLAARALGSVPTAGTSPGTLCLSGPIGRFNAPGQVQSTGASGTLGLALDLSALPVPAGTVAAQVGETWFFQAWHRESMPTPTSNFTDAVALTLQ